MEATNSPQRGIMTGIRFMILTVLPFLSTSCISVHKESDHLTTYSTCKDPIHISLIYKQAPLDKNGNKTEIRISSETILDVQSVEGQEKSPSASNQVRGGLFVNYLHQITRCQIIPVNKENPPSSFLEIVITEDPDNRPMNLWNYISLATLYIIPTKSIEDTEMSLKLIGKEKPIVRNFRRDRSVWFGLFLAPAMPFYPTYSQGHELVLIQLASDAAEFLYKQEPSRIPSQSLKSQPPN